MPERYSFDLEAFGRDIRVYRKANSLPLGDYLCDQTYVSKACQSRLERAQIPNPRLLNVISLAEWAGLDLARYIRTHSA